MYTLEDVMKKLEELGTEQTKNTFMRHGAKEPFDGVKIGDLKKLVKDVKKDQALALALFETGHSDAMYLAGLSVNPKLMSKEILQGWVKNAYWYMIAEFTVAGVAAESKFALELARVWMNSDDEMIATCGWSTYAGYISITPDAQIDLNEVQNLLEKVKTTIHEEKNRIRYTMNTFVISVAAYIPALHEHAVEVAEHIGKVHVDVGNTACKVPFAPEYIKKIVDRGKVGVKKKTCIC